MVTENVHVILWYGFLSQLFKLHWGKKNQNRKKQVKIKQQAAVHQLCCNTSPSSWNLLAVTLLPVNSGS